MKKLAAVFLSVAAASMLAACSSTPTRDAVVENNTPVLTVTFASGQYSATSMKAGDWQALQNLAQRIKATGKPVKMLVVGYADPTGSASLNQKLSTERAETVRKILADDGLTVEQISIQGDSSNNPVKECSGSLPHAQLVKCLAPDRRAEVYLLP